MGNELHARRGRKRRQSYAAQRLRASAFGTPHRGASYGVVPISLLEYEVIRTAMHRGNSRSKRKKGGWFPSPPGSAMVCLMELTRHSLNASFPRSRTLEMEGISIRYQCIALADLIIKGHSTNGVECEHGKVSTDNQPS